MGGKIQFGNEVRAGLMNGQVEAIEFFVSTRWSSRSRLRGKRWRIGEELIAEHRNLELENRSTRKMLRAAGAWSVRTNFRRCSTTIQHWRSMRINVEQT